MASLVVGHTYRTRLVTFSGAQVGLNILYYRCFQGPALADQTEQSFADHMSQLVAPLYRAILPEQASFRGVGVRDVATPLALEFTQNGQSQAGLVQGGIGAKQIAGLVAKFTAVNTPRARGRMYAAFPGLGSMETDGRPTGVYENQLDAMADVLFANISFGPNLNPTVMEPVIFSPGPGIIQINKIIQHRTRNRWATQRRRGDFGPTNIVPF